MSISLEIEEGSFLEPPTEENEPTFSENYDVKEKRKEDDSIEDFRLGNIHQALDVPVPPLISMSLEREQERESVNDVPLLMLSTLQTETPSSLRRSDELVPPPITKATLRGPTRVTLSTNRSQIAATNNEPIELESYHDESKVQKLPPPEFFSINRCKFITIAVFFLISIIVVTAVLIISDTSSVHHPEAKFIVPPSSDESQVLPFSLIRVNLAGWTGDVEALYLMFGSVEITPIWLGDGSSKQLLVRVPIDFTPGNYSLIISDVKKTTLATLVYTVMELQPIADNYIFIRDTFDGLMEYSLRARTRLLQDNLDTDERADINSLFMRITEGIDVIYQKFSVVERRRRAEHELKELVAFMRANAYFFRIGDNVPTINQTLTTAMNGNWIEIQCGDIYPKYRYWVDNIEYSGVEHQKLLAAVLTDLLPILDIDDVELLYWNAVVSSSLSTAKEYGNSFITCSELAYRLHEDGKIKPDFDQSSSVLKLRNNVAEEFEIQATLRSMKFRDSFADQPDPIALAFRETELLTPFAFLVMNEFLPDSLQQRAPVMPRADKVRLDLSVNSSYISIYSFTRSDEITCELIKNNEAMALLCKFNDPSNKTPIDFNITIEYRFLMDFSRTNSIAVTLSETDNPCVVEGRICHSEAKCLSVNGSKHHNCVCRDGFWGDGSMCFDIDECAFGTDNCNELSMCINTLGSFTCECMDGFIGVHQCEDIDECKTGAHDCHSNNECTNTLGTFTCACSDGYHGDGMNCTDINECALHIDACPLYSTCVNSLGSYTCECNDGFLLINELCENIDECVSNIHDCSPYADCFDTLGAFDCTCRIGYSGTGRNCSDEIIEITDSYVNECDAGIHSCSPNSLCIDLEEGFLCRCRSGFRGNGFDCTDYDECAAGIAGCDPHATCENVVGSYTCTCEQGFFSKGPKCINIDECADTSSCHPDAICTDTDGGFDCTCSIGFIGDGFTSCVDIDECRSGTHNCTALSSCVNELPPVRFRCECKQGFTWNGTSCYDIDECEKRNKCDWNALCTNTHGKYNCRCNMGFLGDGHICIDINECSAGMHNCHTNAICENLSPGFQCSCKQGFTGGGVMCSDINECSTGLTICDQHASCINLEGSSSCLCDSGYSRNTEEICVVVNCTRSTHWVERSSSWKIISASIDNPGINAASMMIDGETTYWKGGSTSQEWVAINMGNVAYTLKGVRITRRKLRAKTCEWHVSDRNANTIKVLKQFQFDDTQRNIEIFFDETSSGYWKLYILDSYSGFIGIEEIDFFGFTCGEVPDSSVVVEAGVTEWNQKLFMSNNIHLESPDGIALYRDGTIIIANEAGENIIIVDLQTENVEIFADMGLSSPEEVATDKLGRVWVTDDKKKAVFRFDEKGSDPIILMSSKDGLDSPEGIVFSPQGHVYVADEHMKKIWKLVNGVGPPIVVAEESDGINRPEGMAISPQGVIYVTDDFRGGCIRIIDDKPSWFLRRDQLPFPEAVTVDKDNNVWFTDNDPAKVACSVYQFNSDGDFLQRIEIKVPAGGISGLVVLPSGELVIAASYFLVGRRHDELWLLSPK